MYWAVKKLHWNPTDWGIGLGVSKRPVNLILLIPVQEFNWTEKFKVNSLSFKYRRKNPFEKLSLMFCRFSIIRKFLSQEQSSVLNRCNDGFFYLVRTSTGIDLQHCWSHHPSVCSKYPRLIIKGVVNSLTSYLNRLEPGTVAYPGGGPGARPPWLPNFEAPA